ncbi:nucleotidyltransferase, partial [Vibrio parahaemolyticus]
KEGRKFGMFLTLSSQRPADISPTIMSQIHNFFIHRLVNDKDLFLIDNTISTLDRMSKSLIPNLSKGACVVTGTAFDLPIVIQVDYIENKESRPASDDVDLADLWGLVDKEEA